MNNLSSLLIASLLLSTAAFAEDFFPTGDNHVWTYEAKVTPSSGVGKTRSGSYVLETLGIERSEGNTVVSLRARDSFSPRLKFPTIVQGDGGLVLEGVTYLGSLAQDTVDHSIRLMEFPLVERQRIDDGDWIAYTKERVELEYRGSPIEARKFYVIGTHEARYTIVGDLYFSPGLGLVKVDATIVDYHIEMQLSSMTESNR